MIDIKNGILMLNSNRFLLKKGLTKNEFEISNLFNEVLNYQAYGYSSYYLKPQLIGKYNFSLVLYFNQNDIIDFINLGLEADINSPWSNWSESEELRKKDEHDKWLLRNIGKPPYSYSWGEISSNYDPRSGSSMITIRYYNK